MKYEKLHELKKTGKTGYTLVAKNLLYNRSQLRSPMQLAGAEKVTAGSERTRKPAAPSGDQRDPTNAGGRDSPAQSARPAGAGGQRHHSAQAWRCSDGERVGGSAEPALPPESRRTGSLGRRLRRPELPGTRPACAPLRPPSATAAPGGREAPGVAPLLRTDRRRRCSATAAAAPAGCPAAEGTQNHSAQAG